MSQTLSPLSTRTPPPPSLRTPGDFSAGSDRGGYGWDRNLPAPLTDFSPSWLHLEPGQRHGFFESWSLRLSSTDGKRSLCLRFRVHLSQNGFRRVSEIWALGEERRSGQDIQKFLIRQAFDFVCFQWLPAGNGLEKIQIEDAALTPASTQGKISSKGRTLAWNLKWSSPDSEKEPFERIPGAFQGFHSGNTLQAGLRISGECEIDGEKWLWTDSPGSLDHEAGKKLPASWVWTECSSFLDLQSQKPAACSFEGFEERAQLIGKIQSPSCATFRIRYEGKDYRFQSLWESFRARSKREPQAWSFRVDRGELSFRGKVTAELRELSGYALEDTEGSLAYVAQSGLARLELQIYRKGKIEANLVSHGGARFELASRAADPYINLLA